MKNVTISLDDDVHHSARIKAAEIGTSLSALVKQYLVSLAAGDAQSHLVREVPVPFAAALAPRKLGQMKGEIWYAENWQSWPAEVAAQIDGDNPADPLNW